MPQGPKGEKRPADVIGNAVRLMRIATGEIDEPIPPDDGKDPAAVSLGRKGGKARAEARAAAARIHPGRTKPGGPDVEKALPVHSSPSTCSTRPFISRSSAINSRRPAMASAV